MTAPKTSEQDCTNPDCPGDCKRYCMCGSEIEAHNIGSGHSPVSIYDYYCSEIINGAKENDGKTTSTNGGATGYKRSGYER